MYNLLYKLSLKRIAIVAMSLVMLLGVVNGAQMFGGGNSNIANSVVGAGQLVDTKLNDQLQDRIVDDLTDVGSYTVLDSKTEITNHQLVTFDIYADDYDEQVAQYLNANPKQRSSLLKLEPGERIVETESYKLVVGQNIRFYSRSGRFSALLTATFEVDVSVDRTNQFWFVGKKTNVSYNFKRVTWNVHDMHERTRISMLSIFAYVHIDPTDWNVKTIKDTAFDVNNNLRVGNESLSGLGSGGHSGGNWHEVVVEGRFNMDVNWQDSTGASEYSYSMIPIQVHHENPK